MDRINDPAIALTDLGAVSVETQGNQGLDVDFVGMQTLHGLTDED